MNKLKIGACGFAIALATTGLTAATASADAVCPSNNVTVVRTSKITGTMDGFKKAVADHRAWYQSHGYKADEFIIAPILTYDAATKTMSVSPTTVMTFHTHAGSVTKDKQDAGWTAYVNEYRANSEITSETVICMP